VGKGLKGVGLFDEGLSIHKLYAYLCVVITENSEADSTGSQHDNLSRNRHIGRFYSQKSAYKISERTAHRLYCSVKSEIFSADFFIFRKIDYVCQHADESSACEKTGEHSRLY